MGLVRLLISNSPAPGGAMRFCAERRAALTPNERSKAGFKMHYNNFTDKGTATTRRPAS